jgi:hypothetical protein
MVYHRYKRILIIQHYLHYSIYKIYWLYISSFLNQYNHEVVWNWVAPPYSPLYVHGLNICFHSSIEPNHKFDTCNSKHSESLLLSQIIVNMVGDMVETCVCMYIHLCVHPSNNPNISCSSTATTVHNQMPFGIITPNHGMKWMMITSTSFAYYLGCLVSKCKNQICSS